MMLRLQGMLIPETDVEEKTGTLALPAGLEA